jgi:DNA-binding XRE family transcriptional regulator
MNKKRAVELAGSQAALARLLGVTKQAVNQWPEGRMPELQVYRLRDLKPRWFRKAL